MPLSYLIDSPVLCRIGEYGETIHPDGSKSYPEQNRMRGAADLAKKMAGGGGQKCKVPQDLDDLARGRIGERSDPRQEQKVRAQLTATQDMSGGVYLLSTPEQNRLQAANADARHERGEERRLLRRRAA